MNELVFICAGGCNFTTDQSPNHLNPVTSQCCAACSQNTKWKVKKVGICNMANRLVKHAGGCHCGAVRYEVMAPAHVTVLECNCTVCRKKQIRSFTVPCSRFKLISGHDSLTTYTFNTHQAKHNFCKICGVQSFYIPRSNPDGIGVIIYCLDEGTVQKVTVQSFDGKNWEESMKKNPSIQAMSKDSKSSNNIMYSPN